MANGKQSKGKKSSGEGKEQQTKVRLGGLWKNKTSDGKIFLAGNLGQGRLLIFQNGFKKADSDNSEPDYIMYVVPQKPREEDEGEEKKDAEPDDIPF